MTDNLIIPVDRITYRQGQRLTARDLDDDDQGRDARLRRLHTRYLHDTWGIAMGFEISQASGGTEVQIGRGYAVDAVGRDILLAEDLPLRVPNQPGEQPFVLTMRYREDAVFRQRPDLAALCLSGGHDPRRERPVFTWRRPDEVRFGPEVPLVQVTAKDGVIQTDLDFRVQRKARPLVRPHMGWDTTEPGRTGWRVWRTGYRQLGLEVAVDTSEAGFTRTPHYFATLQGDFSRLPVGESSWFPDLGSAEIENSFFLDNFHFITQAGPESFIYRLIMLEGFPFGESVSVTEAENREWTLSWLGLEPVAGCGPGVDPLNLYFPSGLPVSQPLEAILETIGEV